jgi:hypothetical protein
MQTRRRDLLKWAAAAVVATATTSGCVTRTESESSPTPTGRRLREHVIQPVILRQADASVDRGRTEKIVGALQRMEKSLLQEYGAAPRLARSPLQIAVPNPTGGTAISSEDFHASIRSQLEGRLPPTNPTAKFVAICPPESLVGATHLGVAQKRGSLAVVRVAKELVDNPDFWESPLTAVSWPGGVLPPTLGFGGVVLHEVGHLLGAPDLSPNREGTPGNVMCGGGQGCFTEGHPIAFDLDTPVGSEFGGWTIDRLGSAFPRTLRFNPWMMGPPKVEVALDAAIEKANGAYGKLQTGTVKAGNGYFVGCDAASVCVTERYGVHVVPGSLYAEWGVDGFEKLGLAISDPMREGDRLRQQFEKGVLEASFRPEIDGRLIQASPTPSLSPR